MEGFCKLTCCVVLIRSRLIQGFLCYYSWFSCLYFSDPLLLWLRKTVINDLFKLLKQSWDLRCDSEDRSSGNMIYQPALKIWVWYVNTRLYIHLETILQKPVFIPENIFEMLLLFYSPAASQMQRGAGLCQTPVWERRAANSFKSPKFTRAWLTDQSIDI